MLSAFVACKSKPVLPDAGPADLAAKDTSPAKAPPALRAPHPTVPALPNLPELAQHEPATPLPNGVVLDGARANCKGVWNGFGVTPRSCMKDAAFATKNLDPAWTYGLKYGSAPSGIL